MLAEPGSDVALPEGDTPDVVLADDESVAVVLGRAEELGLDVTDEDVYRVITGLHGYLAGIGAVGPPADPGAPPPAERARRRPPHSAGTRVLPSQLSYRPA